MPTWPCIVRINMCYKPHQTQFFTVIIGFGAGRVRIFWGVAASASRRGGGSIACIPLARGKSGRFPAFGYKEKRKGVVVLKRIYGYLKL